MNEQERLNDELEIPELDFSTPEEEAAQQPTQAGAPEPSPPAAYGPYSQQVRAQYEATQKAYAEAIARKKKLLEAGYSVPVELDAQIAQYAAKLAYLEGATEEAKRRDAMAAIPGIVARLTSELSPEVARIVAPQLRQTLEQAVASNPDIVHNQQALQFALDATLGMIAKQRLAKKTATTTATPGTTAAKPPQTDTPKPVEMPEVARRLGISEKAWKAVEALEGEADFDIFG